MWQRSPRREFLQQAGATAAAAAIAPTLMGMTRKSGSSPIVLGSGAHTYEWLPDWGQLPAGVQYGYTHGVAVDEHHRVFVHNQSKDAMIIFDEKGKFIKSWGPEFAKGAHGLTLRKEGNTEYLYLADLARHMVFKTTLDGEEIWRLPYPKQTGIYKEEKQYVPTNVAIAPNGDIYVADGYGLSWVHQYNAKTDYIRSWGGKGSAPGKMDCPHGIWVDTRQAKHGRAPILTVADRSNKRLQRFTLDGQHIDFITDELRAPCHFDQRGEELLIPDLHGRVTIFDRNNKLITHLGDTPDVWKEKGYPNLPHSERVDGHFISPHSSCWDRHGNIIVVEWISDGRVHKLRRV